MARKRLCDNTSGEGWTYFAAIGYERGFCHKFNHFLSGTMAQNGMGFNRDYQNFGKKELIQEEYQWWYFEC